MINVQQSNIGRKSLLIMMYDNNYSQNGIRNVLTEHCIGVSPRGGVPSVTAQNKDMQYSSGNQPERNV